MGVWFKIFAKELLSDSKILQLEDEELGKLLKLWAFCFQDGSIPNDPSALCKLLRGSTKKQMQKHLNWINQFFVPMPEDPSRLISLRLQAEREAYEEKCQKLRQNGTKGGRPHKANGYTKAKANGYADNNLLGTDTEAEVRNIPLPPSGGERDLVSIWPRGKRLNLDEIRIQLELALTSVDLGLLLNSARAYLEDVRERNPRRPGQYVKRLDLWLKERGYEPFLDAEPPLEDLSQVDLGPDPLIPRKAS